ncbi:hypothetical protein MPSEU_000905400 [Mayamaea pseudoterrestris]|nr:hypothetical protein MPSEU_000905400 [Mayamaea pseudoterrestris]
MDNLPSPNIQDGPMVGTPLILQSKYVAEAPERVNRPVPVPSFYSDDRGEIHNVCVGQTKSTGSQRKGQRINLLYTKAGVMRSGDLHPNTQHDFVFSGSVKVWTLQKDGHTHVHVYNKNDVIAIPPFTPHLFEFEQDSVLAEWWDGDFKAWFYEPTKLIVAIVLLECMACCMTDRFGWAFLSAWVLDSPYICNEQGTTK